MDDYRVKVGFFDHPKTRKLERALGLQAVVSLLRVWDFAAQYRPDGHLDSLDNEDVAAAGRWPGDADEFVAALVRCRLLDQTDNGLAIHDWAEANPYVATKSTRIAKAKRAAAARWVGGEAPQPMLDDKSSNAKVEVEQCSNTDRALLESESSNATSPIEQCPPPLHHQHTTQPLLLCCWGERREKTVADLNKHFEAEFGRSLPPKWFPVASANAPYSLAEIGNATVEAKREQKASPGLVVRILERYRNTQPAETRARAGPKQERSAFREVTERLEREWVNDQTDVSGAHDKAAGLLPTTGR